MLNALLTLTGGLGLFMLGLLLMTDGLRTGAGHTLSATLQRATETPLKAFLAGAGITALLQSSSVVTVMLLGFIEAGLLNLSKGIWVVYGTNVGTTFTAWLVATIGLKIDVIAGASPLIALGTAVRLFRGAGRSGGWGAALAGLGLLFLGLEYMQQAFSSHTLALELPELNHLPSFPALLAYVMLGAGITALIQSSSATTAIILAALASHALTWSHAAAMVIGANIGTTVTALIASIGVSTPAKRLALAHLLFNSITAIAALAILPLFMQAVAWLTERLEGYDDPLIQLAAFHTLFNLFGVVLLWPFTQRLVTFLNHQFRNPALDRWSPPDLALSAELLPDSLITLLDRQARETGQKVLQFARELLPWRDPADPAEQLAAAHRYLQQLEARMLEIIKQLPESSLEDARPLRYLHMVHEYTQLLNWLQHWTLTAQTYQPPPWLKQDLEQLEQKVAAFLELVDPMQTLTSLGEERLIQTYADIKQSYESFKRTLYARLKHHELDVAQVEGLIERANYARLIALTARKAYHWLNTDENELILEPEGKRE